MTDKERKSLARDAAKEIVAHLRESNAQAVKRGAPEVEETAYRGLQRVMTRKLLRE